MRSRFIVFVFLLVIGLLLLAACAPATEMVATADEPTALPQNSETEPDPYPASNEVFLPVTGSEAAAYPAPEQSAAVSQPYPGMEDAPRSGNPAKVLEFNDLAPVATDKDLIKGQVFIESGDIELLSSVPSSVELVVVGTLPTPCHALRVVVSEPDKNNQIAIEAYSVSDPETMCVQMLEPFTVSIPLEKLAAGKYTVAINQQQVAEFEIP